MTDKHSSPGSSKCIGTNLNITTLKHQFIDLDNDPQDMQCLLCEEIYLLPNDKQNFLTHLFNSHRLIISDVEKIASLKSYIHYWRIKFRDEPLVKFCTKMLMNCTPDGTESTNEPYYLLSDSLAEDKTLRAEIHQAKLEWILKVQEQERSDTTFKRGCMICKTNFTGSRSLYLQHLHERHNIQIGRPENLIFVDEFLDKIEENITNLICIYCEQKFKNRSVLKEHMRKKMHKRVKPSNTYYDKFYVVNYLKNGQISNLKKDASNNATNNTITNIEDDNDYEENNDWSDWIEENIDIRCLFCNYNNKEFSEILEHMLENHNFDLEEVTKNMDFYKKIRMVNYIRYQIHSSRCIFCGEIYEDIENHMKVEDHCKLPDETVWIQPEFYFSTFDDDSFLYNLEESNIDLSENLGNMNINEDK